ncbi:hypothetical protein BK816_00230 [Boudabousia tangfeifanii]|uniref:Arc-like DNA binding domain-containing protein n=1 Tax=Boudabousia tangfeifanii TaxID=1912795 RepID=A0A1D9MI93_9ACTO|nr:Arc family DNA-binding protein [Boudabousia tangfeifanii]AOZ71909.1 hypothetical protein BK816_00230 [Boudabousia tangfeifanii]
MAIDPVTQKITLAFEHATALADEETKQVAEKLIQAITPALHLTYLETLTELIGQINQQLPYETQVQLTSHGPKITTQAPSPLETDDTTDDTTDLEDGQQGTTRLTLRLPENLKNQLETQANSNHNSLNTEIVNAIRKHVAKPAQQSRSHFNGWLH